MSHKKLLVILFLVFSSFQHFYAQDASPSPYSFFGMGDVTFKGAVENISMGGINAYVDSLHYNMNNVASLSELKFVSFSFGMLNNFVLLSDTQSKDWRSTHKASYFSLALPFGKKAGFGFGLTPVTSVGYKILKKTETDVTSYSGRGGTNKVFVAGSYKINKYVSIGAEYQYYFGHIDHEYQWKENDVYTFTQENNQSISSGHALKVGANFFYDFKQNKYATFNTNFRLESKLSQENVRETKLISSNGVVESITNKHEFTKLLLPYELSVGTGYGSKNRWFIGFEFDYVGLNNFKNNFYDPSYLTYSDARKFKLGGFYTPQHNSITSYWKRITYRLGINYQDTGMRLYNEAVNDFGITFGLGLPAGRKISNLNIGFEVGQKGKVSSHLIKENYFNIHIGLSLNDSWFIKRKIN